jgi:hypothetical protein
MPGFCPDEIADRKGLPGWRDIVVGGRQKKDRAPDRLQIELPAKPHEFAAGKLVSVKELLDDLEIIGSRQIDRSTVPIPKSLQNLGSIFIHLENRPEQYVIRLLHVPGRSHVAPEHEPTA